MSVRSSLLSLSLFTPAILYAAAPGNFADVVDRATSIIASIVPVLVGLGVLLFFWGLARFIYGAGSGNEKTISEGKALMLWGIVALFVTFSLWGLARMMSNFFFHSVNTSTPPQPYFPSPGGFGS